MDTTTDAQSPDPLMPDSLTPDPLTPDSVRLRRPIGQIFVELGFITRAQLDDALEVQRTTGARIGEILVDQGSLSRLDLASALAEHWEPVPREPDVLELSLLRGVAPVSPAERTESAAAYAAIAELELRLQAVEAAIVALDGLELRQQDGVDRDPADRFEALAARIDRTERDGHETVAQLADELRVEAAARAADVGARLHAESDETAALRARVEELEAEAARARTDAEQATAVWRNEAGSLAARIDELLALRYADAQAAVSANAGGNGRRHSVERLSAAIADADTRGADELPVSAAEGCVAFAPTPTGYRLVEIHGPPPDLGATVEVDECESPLVVTRYGRSPLPFDRRPCAYLDRV